MVGRSWSRARRASPGCSKQSGRVMDWSGVSTVLERVGVSDTAVEGLFTGADRGIDGGIEQAYERSLAVADLIDAGALLAYELNGAPLPPQHGFPLRLVVPCWYGMTNVKWLTAINWARRAILRLPAVHCVSRAIRRCPKAGNPSLA